MRLRLAITAISLALMASMSGCGGDHKPSGKQGVYVFDLIDGTVTRVVDEEAFVVAWDGDTTAWYSTSFLPGGDGAVHSVEITAKKRRTVIDLEGGGFASIAPSASRVAYVRDADGTLTVEVADVGGERRSLGEGIGAEVSPDGERALYLTPACAASTALRIADVDDAGGGKTIDDAFAASWLPDGRVAFEQAQGDPGLPSVAQIYDPASDIVRPTSDVLGFDPAGVYFLSPDGSRVLYGADVNRIFLRDVAAKSDVEIGAGRAALAAWSPDSTLIAYAAFDVLHMADRDGVERYAVDLKQLGDQQTSAVALAWSPDGSKIAIGSGHVPAGGVCDDTPTAESKG